ncbi:MAG: Uncharacterised protein [Prochlorococcus marinus str. MIT 9313]|nr:MAG: Uncharacterised protein [Prochlorococcus marinus str. MIT 9313]
MPKEQVAMVEREIVPLFEIDLDLDLIASDFLEGDERWIYRCCRLHEHPALHLWRQLPLKALEFAHGLDLSPYS